MDPVLSQAVATLITAAATVLLMWAAWRFPRGHHSNDSHDDDHDKGSEATEDA